MSHQKSQNWDMHNKSVFAFELWISKYTISILKSPHAYITLNAQRPLKLHRVNPVSCHNEQSCTSLQLQNMVRKMSFIISITRKTTGPTVFGMFLLGPEQHKCRHLHELEIHLLWGARFYCFFRIMFFFFFVFPGLFIGLYCFCKDFFFLMEDGCTWCAKGTTRRSK